MREKITKSWIEKTIHEKAKKAGISNSQLYKQAGNAVTVDVIEQIGKRLVLE